MTKPYLLRHYQFGLLLAAPVIVAVAVAGYVLVFASRAATMPAAFEAENGTRAAPAQIQTDSSASGGARLLFGGGGASRQVAVSNATALTSALAAARPGDVITLADGTYSGHFTSTASGAVGSPIVLTGSRQAIINGGSLGSGYTLSLGVKNSTSTVSYWKLEGFTLTGGQKGIMFDNVQHSLINNVLVQHIGQEGIHLRNNSSDNTVINSTVTRTGQDTQAYGEGMYVGSAVSNWSAYSQGQPDHSNRNQMLNNTISFTGAENIDIKEGTHAGTISGNHFDGSGMCWDATDSCNFGDSWIDMKGEGWTVSNNIGAHMHALWSNGNQTNDGFQNHVTSNTGAEGSGSNNVYANNQLSDVGGYGFNIQSSATGVVVRCSNTVTGAGSGFGNVACRP